MMEDLLIVDGYNVIHASESYRPLINTDLETARARLIEDVAGYARFSGTSATVVFDASKRKGAARGASEILGVTVVFTKEGETADEAIRPRVPTESSHTGVHILTRHSRN